MVDANNISVLNIDASTASIKDLSVVTAKIAALAVTEAKIANLAVTNAKINDLSAVKITAGTLSVGGTNQATAILIGQSLLTGNARLGWVGGSRMWEDSSNRIGINSIGDMYIYRGSQERIYIGENNINLYPTTVYTNNLDLHLSSNEGSIYNVDQLKGYNDLKITGNGDVYFYRDGSEGAGARIEWGTGKIFSYSSSINLGGTDKTAIVPTSKGYHSLYCTESPEVWFMDFAKGRKIRKWPKFWNLIVEVFPDELFLEVCEPPFVIMPTATKGLYQVWGIRKGHGGKRFEEKTKEEYDRNNEFWSTPQRKVVKK
jgi:hypothetical protein